MGSGSRLGHVRHFIAGRRSHTLLRTVAIAWARNEASKLLNRDRDTCGVEILPRWKLETVQVSPLLHGLRLALLNRFRRHLW